MTSSYAVPPDNHVYRPVGMREEPTHFHFNPEKTGRRNATVAKRSYQHKFITPQPETVRMTAAYGGPESCIVVRPDSVRTRWEDYCASPEPVAGVIGMDGKWRRYRGKEGTGGRRIDGWSARCREEKCAPLHVELSRVNENKNLSVKTCRVRVCKPPAWRHTLTERLPAVKYA